MLCGVLVCEYLLDLSSFCSDKCDKSLPFLLISVQKGRIYWNVYYLYRLYMDIMLTERRVRTIFERMKSIEQKQERKPRAIAMSRVQRMDLVPSLNALTLGLVAFSTAFYTLVLGL